MSFERVWRKWGNGLQCNGKAEDSSSELKAPGKFLGHGHCWDLTRSQKVTTPVHTKEEIINLVYSICHGIMRSHCRGVKRAKSENFEISSIRGIGIQLNNLVAYDSQENSKTKTLSQCWGS